MRVDALLFALAVSLLLSLMNVELFAVDSADPVAPETMQAAVGLPVRLKTAQGASFQGVLKDVAKDRVEIIADDGRILQIDLDSIIDFESLDKTITKGTFF